MKALFSCADTPRNVKKLIIQLLKIQGVISVQRMNYVKTYTLEKWSVVSHEEKLLVVDFLNEKEQLLSCLKKYHPLKDGITVTFLS